MLRRNFIGCVGASLAGSSLFSVVPAAWAAAPALTERQRVGLGCSAILSFYNEWPYDRLLISASTANALRVGREVLKRDWDIADKSDALDVIENLYQRGHNSWYQDILAAYRKKAASGQVVELSDIIDPVFQERMTQEDIAETKWRIEFVKTSKEKTLHIVAWDLCRIVIVARMARSAEYFDDQTAWKQIEQAVDRLTGFFHSWAELGENYLIGRSFWLGPEQSRQHQFIGAYKWLTSPEALDSPWNQTPWPKTPS